MLSDLSHTSKFYALGFPAGAVVVMDQISKYMVRTMPELQNWEIIPGVLAFHYTQNPGMALGMDWASTPVISSIAIVATIAILVYVIKTMGRASTGYLLCMGLVIGGALGNILDRIFMARLESYGGILEGHVVDFIHFTMITPDWLPWLGGAPVFPYIFNVADMAISTAIIALLIFHRRLLHHEEYDEGGESSVGR